MELPTHLSLRDWKAEVEQASADASALQTRLRLARLKLSDLLENRPEERAAEVLKERRG